MSLILGILGQIISFYPGAECEWFALAAILAIPGFIIPKWSYRSATLAMLVLWSAMSFAGYARGREYQQWRKQQSSREERIQEAEQMLKSIESTEKQGVKGSQNKSMQATANSRC